MHGQSAGSRFLVFTTHVLSSIPHGLDYFVETYNCEIGGTLQGQLRSCYRLDSTHGISFDTGYLNESGNRIAGKTKVVLHGNFCCHKCLSLAHAHRFG